MLDNGNAPHILDFGEPEKENSIIKVIGVGGGGGNAVNHMYREGIHDVTFVLCNTDNQALNDSPVPVHLQLGKEGLGAGNKPAKARQAAEETLEDIKNMLNDGTKMAFITAGMGGGTGTGAAPVIARVSKELGILTVGIVTIPFRFEGPKKIDQALDGVEEMSKHVDALLVINNERLRQIYPDLAVLDAFGKADDTLSVAAKSIAEIITVHGLINLDFNDVKTVLKDGGVAIMSTGYGEGEGRVKKAIEDALNSPLLNDNDVFNSKKILLSIAFASEKKDNPGLTMDEMNDVNDCMEKFGDDFELKWGLASDPDVGPRAGWPAHKSVEESREIIRTFFHNETTWAIVLKETGEAIGCIGYYTHETSNIPIGENDCEVGYWVGKPFWNQGICTETLKLMLDYCINEKHFENIWADHFTGNPASGRVMEKCGFSDTGMLNRCSQLVGGDKEMVKVFKYNV